jgi:hypothetical protein
MSFVYVPVFDCVGKRIGYVPPWFLVGGQLCLILCITALLSIAIPGFNHKLGEIPSVVPWYQFSLGVGLCTFPVFIWYTVVIDELTVHTEKPMWPSVLSLTQ